MTKRSPHVVVLMGGPSEEHEVSLRSGSGVVEALTERQFVVEPVVIPRTLTVQDACAFARRALQRTAPDVVFLALHGPFGEDGTMQQVCEDLQLSYTGSDVEASRLGMDKVASRHQLIAAGLTVPRWQAVSSEKTDGLDLRGWRFPLIVKPSGQGSSIGVSRVAHPDAVPAALQEAGRHGMTLLVEEFIEGGELTVGVLDGRPLPVVEIRPTQGFFDFAAKYTVGMTEYHAPARLRPSIAARVQEAGRRAHETLGCRHFSRTDLILNRANVPVILEVNTIPGLTPTSLLPKAAACAGISYGELCEQLVQMACPPTNLPTRIPCAQRTVSATPCAGAPSLPIRQVGGGAGRDAPVIHHQASVI